MGVIKDVNIKVKTCELYYKKFAKVVCMNKNMRVGIITLLFFFVACTAGFLAVVFIEAEVIKTVRKNPSVLMEILSNDCEELYRMTQRGENQIYENGLREAWLVDAKQNDRINKISFAGSPTKGNKNSPVKIVVYSDFFCRYCRELAPDIAKLSAKYSLGYVYKTLPLAQIPNAELAAEYFIGAFLVSPEKAWKLHDEFYKNPQHIVKEGEKYFNEVLGECGFNVSETVAVIKSQQVKRLVERDVKEAENLGIQFRPCIFIGNLKIPGKVSFELLCEAAEIAISKVKTKK